ncbi:MAG: acyl-CoA thioesterase [Microcoleaceae cyanobacterium]
MSDSQFRVAQSFFQKINFTNGWFEYPIHAFPHHTDYAGIVWHGTYLNWMEEARVEGLRLAGIDYRDLVTAGCDLPVVDANIRYHQSIKMGMDAVVRARLLQPSKIRLLWDYQIKSIDRQVRYVTAQITLVPVDRATGKVMRRLPENLKTAFDNFLIQ